MAAFRIELDESTILGARSLGAMIGLQTTGTFTIGDEQADEGDLITFTVTRDDTTVGTETVSFAFSGDDADPLTDYDSTSTLSVTFEGTETVATFTVQTREDISPEPNETFTVTLTGSTDRGAGSFVGGSATGTIVDDGDIAPTTYTLVGGTADEGGVITFTLTRTGDTSGAQSIRYSVGGGSDTAQSSDYITPPTDTFEFAAGEAAATITFQTVEDAFDEAEEERFTVTLEEDVTTFPSLRSGIGVLNLEETFGQTSTGVIVDDDSYVVSTATVTEGDTASIIVTRFGDTSQTATLEYTLGATSDTAEPGSDPTQAGDDYIATSGEVEFGAGEATATIFVRTVEDDVAETPATETFTVTLLTEEPAFEPGDAFAAADVMAPVSMNTATVTITDDDVAVASPTISISDETGAEGDNGTTSLTFEVSLNAPSLQTVTVDLATVDGTADAGSDYEAITGTVTFAPGETTQTFTVQVTGDMLDEADETFAIQLSNATNATFTDGEGLGTITDNDASPTISISDVTQAEGNSGTTSFTFNVLLGAPSGQTVAVDFATGNGTAVAGSDYSATTGTVTFMPGQTSTNITVQVAGDTAVESDETFFVNLSNATNATFTDGEGLGTITNDDMAPAASSTFFITGDTVFEGETATFEITRTGGSLGSETISVETSEDSADEGEDFSAPGVLVIGGVGTSFVTFDAGVTTIAFTVPTIDNDGPGDENEDLETFGVSIIAAQNGIGSGSITSATGVIVENPASTATSSGTTFFSITGDTVVEGGTAVFEVARSGDTGSATTVFLSSSDGTAVRGQDYIYGTDGEGTVSFGPGDTRKTVTVSTSMDGDTGEGAETFFIRIDRAELATSTSTTFFPLYPTSSATGVILDGPAPTDPGGGGSGGNPSPAPFTFTEFDDVYTGSEESERLVALAGNDSVEGSLGNDNIAGKTGDDTLRGGQGNDTLFGGQGNDRVFGDTGDDTIFGNLGNDIVSGNQGNDTVSGGQGNDTVFGGQGNDRMFGGQGDDLVFGNLGDDLVSGNMGNDLVNGGQGNDTLYGGQGNDTIVGGLGNDLLFGNLGADRFVFGTNSGMDRVGGFSQSSGDRLDLQGQTFTTSTGPDGSAVLTLSGGGTVTLAGVAPGSVNPSFFA